MGQVQANILGEFATPSSSSPRGTLCYVPPPMLYGQTTPGDARAIPKDALPPARVVKDAMSGHPRQTTTLSVRVVRETSTLYRFYKITSQATNIPPIYNGVYYWSLAMVAYWQPEAISAEKVRSVGCPRAMTTWLFSWTVIEPRHATRYHGSDRSSLLGQSHVPRIQFYYAFWKPKRV